MDDRVIHIWRWFSDLHFARAPGGFAPAPISYSEIAAYQAVTGEIMERWEVRAIRQVDIAMLSAFAGHASESTPEPPPPDPDAMKKLFREMGAKPV